METITNEKGWPACARSLDNANLLSDFDVHFEDPAKMIRGVCHACHAKLMKTHKGFLAGKVESPVDLNSREHFSELKDHVGMEAGGVCQTTEFDWSAVDGILDDVPPDARQQAAEVLQRVFQWCYSRGSKTPLTQAAAKLATLVSGLNPSMLDGRTLASLGKELGKTKAAMSKTSLVMQDKAGFKLARSRPLSSRAAMRKARLGGPDRHHRKATQ